MDAWVLAAKGITEHIGPIDLTTRGGLDVVALMVLVGWLYRRRPSAPAMPLVLVALNLGLFAAMSAISAGKFPAGVGFGLFGILSLVRLRSAAFTLRDVAYTFVTLVIALCTGLPQRDSWLVIALDAAVLVAVLLVDDPRAYQPPTRTVKLTLDRIYDDPSVIAQDVALRFGQAPLSVAVDEVDYVRETTRVSARYPVVPAEGGTAQDTEPREQVTAA
ncbi:DUF4956 domain-containing protein [Streptomyces pluripotens]|uniref:DUF4956 domain-containing protein n=1 Tax=Streptomyces pluripotens TaxID=1355015 RepID=A0A221P1A0_9ACTN|nr:MULTISPECIES: DUF4956 domain-containing protein [Streptomyces]ARP71695.1 DUF4956 domain-containing protein [Streptomyces pluripotens]ASN25947.1 DUF4956 domain-containing protein [Streptomyces pluripotens]MCH0557634.1 DUF4956 domain-containing protein [Streptomyces sp. MUM 16J]